MKTEFRDKKKLHLNSVYVLCQAFGVSKEEFDSYISNGIIIWGQPVIDVLEEGKLRIEQTMKSEITPLVSILIEGLSSIDEILFNIRENVDSI